MYTSVIFSFGTPDFSIAALMAVAPSRGAGTVTNAPLNFAVGVLAALKMYASWISFRAGVVELKCRLTCARRAFERELVAIVRRAGVMREVGGMTNINV